MKTEKNMLKYLIILLLSCVCSVSFAANQELYDQKQWSLLYYYGQTVNGALIGIPTGNFKHWPEHIQSFELAYTLDENNRFRQFFNPIVGVVQIAGNYTVRYGNQESRINEFDPYIMFRWANFPWNDTVTTSLALAEGVSYVSSVPSIEKRGADNNNLGHLLNYLMFEATFARPSQPELQLVVRIHHRSGAFGLYQVSNGGSNDIGLGIRYLF